MADLGKVQQAVVSAGASGVRNLAARQNGNAIEIHGTAASLAQKQSAFKTITDSVGDSAGVVNLIQVATDGAGQQAQPRPMQPPQPGAIPPPMTSAGTASSQRTHTVGHGETLTGIAHHYYGKASEYQKIFDANRDKLSDPDKVREGMTLIIP